MKAAQQNAGLGRRIAAMTYDALILIALFMLATMTLLPFNHGQAISSHNLGYKIYLLLLWIGFYLWFWYKNGQTIGMMAWRVRLCHQNPNTTPSLRQLFLRLLCAIPCVLLFGLGLLWLIFDKQKLAIYDRLSHTKLILIPKRQR